VKLRIVFILALINLWGRKLRSTLTIGGIAIGIAAIVFLLSLAYGLQNVITKGIADFQSYKVIDVNPIKSSAFHLNNGAIEKIKDFSNIKKVEGITNFAGQAKTEESDAYTETVIYGASRDYLALATVRPTKGQYYDDTKKEAIVNKSLLKLANISEDKALGQQVKLSLEINKSKAPNQKHEIEKVEDSVTIVGILSDEGNPVMYLPMDFFRSKGVEVYQQLKVEAASSDKETIGNIRKNIETLGFKTQSVLDTISQVDQFFAIIRIILSLFGLIAVIVAALGMFNTLTVSLLERTREIGIMKVIGASSKDVWTTFLAESFIMSLIGGLFGIFVGWLIGFGLNMLLINLAKSTGNEMVAIFYIPINLMLLSMIVSVSLAFITGFYPAMRASKISALEAIRYE